MRLKRNYGLDKEVNERVTAEELGNARMVESIVERALQRMV